jgi:hypothetical protein
MRKPYKDKTYRRGGGATVMPLKYYDPTASEPAAAPGHNLLTAIPPIGIRQRIGGAHKIHNKYKSYKAKKGGFVPSVMGNFVAAASKYITPIALFAGYKLLTRKGKRVSKRRHTRRRF